MNIQLFNTFNNSSNLPNAKERPELIENATSRFNWYDLSFIWVIQLVFSSLFSVVRKTTLLYAQLRQLNSKPSYLTMSSSITTLWCQDHRGMAADKILHRTIAAMIQWRTIFATLLRWVILWIFRDQLYFFLKPVYLQRKITGDQTILVEWIL